MELYIPIGILILSIFLAIALIRQSLFERRLVKFRLFLTCAIILTVSLILAVFYKQIKDSDTLTKIFKYVYLGLFVLISFLIVFSINYNMSKKNMIDEYIKVIENDRLFILLDKKNRIIMASQSLRNAYQEDDKPAKKHNFFDYFNQTFKLISLNEETTSNEELESIFTNLKAETTPSSFKRSLKVLNKNSNKIFVINLIDKVIVENGKYKGHALIGSEKTEEDMLDLETQIDEKNQTLDNIRLKFVTHLELTEEAMFFYDLDKNTIWGNEVFKSKLKLNENLIKLDYFYHLIYDDDRQTHKRVLQELTYDNPNYELTYRIQSGASYIYVKEFGKRLYESSTNEIMSYLKIMNTTHFEKTNIEVLDNVKSEANLLTDLNVLFNEGRTFQLAIFTIDNIPNINEQYSRDIGNMIMSEYIKAIARSFAKDEKIYRLSGLMFSFIITDFRKMDILERGLASGKILNAKMNIGSNTYVTNTYMGVSQSNEVQSSTDMYSAAKKALKASKLEQVRTNYIYYKDIK